MAKDWLTGQPLEKQGPNPVAGFLAGLMQAQAMKQEREEAERIQAQKQAMGQIQEGRTLLERLAQMDPTLWADGGFVDAWKAGDITYPAKTGWKPPAPKPSYPDKEVGGNIVRLDPETGEYKVVYQAPQKEAGGNPVVLYDGATLVDPKTGKVIFQSPRTARPSGGSVKPQKTRWVVKPLQLEDGKTHLVQYDLDNPKDKSKWIDLGLAGTASGNTPKGKTVADILAEASLGGGNPTGQDAEEPQEDEDALLLEEIRGYLKP